MVMVVLQMSKETITSSATTYVPFNFNCKLDAHVTDGYIIKQISWDGNIGG